MDVFMQPLFADLGDGLLAALQFVLAFTTYVLLFALPVGALTLVIHFFLSLPLRRRERARLFLDLLETGVVQGRSAEQTLIAVAGSRDRSLGIRFHLLVAHLESGLRLDAALERVPHLLPPPVVAMLHVGARLGDLRRVLPACREWLRERPTSVQSAYHYLIMLLVVFSPVAIFLLINLNIFVWPKLKEVFVGIGEGTPLPAFTRFALESTRWLVGVQVLFMLGLFLAAFVYVAGPRVSAWCRGKLFPFADWLAWHIPWKQKRLVRTFSATLGVLLDGGVPEGEAVRLAADCTANEIARRRAGRVVSALQQGVRLQEAVAGFDDAGEFRWRLTNACHARDGFLRALNGWHEALDAKSFQQEEAAAHAITSGLVLFNGFVVALTAAAVFLALIAVMERGGNMVTHSEFRRSGQHRLRRESGALMTDLMVGLSIFALALLPLGVSFAKEFQLVRANYWRAAAMEIVDGEMEVLAAGEWRAFADGQSAYVVSALAATNLPPGQFQLTKSDRHLRLEWTPEQRKGIGAVVREVTVK